jgi:histidine kinase
MRRVGLIGRIRRRLVFKFTLIVGLTLLVGLAAWAYAAISYQEDQVMRNLAVEADRLSTTVKLGAHYAMMINSRGDIAEIIRNVSRQPEMRAIRIYNKDGEIEYSNHPAEVNRETNIKDEACYVCHRVDPPHVRLSLAERTRVFTADDGRRVLGIINAIYNEPGCATAECHVHPPDKQVLGALDMVLGLQGAEAEMAGFRKKTLTRTALLFLATILVLLAFILLYVNRPVDKMVSATRRLAQGEHDVEVGVDQSDEMGQLAEAITQMGREIGQKQVELRRQRQEYRELFDTVPCLITVQDRDFKLINYNRRFAELFDPEPGDYCFHAYKGRRTKCEPCPVEKTFADGLSHRSEETGFNRDGSMTHWLVITSPVYDENGDISSAMEINLDITERKLLEQELEKSEQKYHAIFNNIPNPIFVLDRENLTVLDINDSVPAVYGFDKDDVLGLPFADLYWPENRPGDEGRSLERTTFVKQAKHRRKDGRHLFVAMRISPSEYDRQRVLLVSISDITKRLEAEQQLNQASKMATLGEMATGVAHELNQPLSVIKMVSSFFIKKINGGERLDRDTLNAMLAKVDRNVDRATKIISHMRLFARKSEMKLSRVHVEDILSNAAEMFMQQLKARGIEIVWDLADDLPPIHADPDRLEQVFVNLIINARDAVEHGRGESASTDDRKIFLRVHQARNNLVIEVEDTGPGVDPSLADKIFDPFFTTKEVGKGTGLGLSITYGIVRDNHGDIRLADNPGGGARFVIEFPVDADEEDHD